MEASGSEAPPERKRKRSNPDQGHRRRLKTCDVLTGKRGGGGEEAEGSASKTSPRPPLDEEVEEFFAILRRMHDDVKYFGKSGHCSNGDGNKRRTDSEIGSPLTAPALNGGPRVDVEQRAVRQAEKSVSFDLNVAPAEANGD